MEKIRSHLKKSKKVLVYHFKYHRLGWSALLCTIFFLLGWILHSESLKHWAEFTLAPLAEAFLSKNME